jgi:hypothetical protein
MKRRLYVVFATTLLISLPHHTALGGGVTGVPFAPCEDPKTSFTPEAFVACKMNAIAEDPFFVSATCGNIKAPRFAKLKLKVEVFGGGIVKKAEIIESNISDPWFAWKLIQNAYSIRLPLITKDSAFDDVEVSMDLKEMSSRMRIYNCKGLYVGAGR